MSDLFRAKIKAAREGKYFPGIAELAYEILANGGSLSQVFSQLYITPSKHAEWMLAEPDYRTAIELGFHASISLLEQNGLQNLTSQFYQGRVWEKLLDRASDKVGIETSKDNEIRITFESLD